MFNKKGYSKTLEYPFLNLWSCQLLNYKAVFINGMG